jgi:hypothetical protein
VTNSIPLGSPLLLPVDTVNYVAALQDYQLGLRFARPTNKNQTEHFKDYIYLTQAVHGARFLTAIYNR